MEDSDDDFAWTGASNDSEDSEAMYVEQKNDHTEKYESDNGFKKKLQKKLFQEHDQSDFNENELQKKKTKKRKIKENHLKHEEDESACGDGDGGGAERVKVEPESDGGPAPQPARKRRRTSVVDSDHGLNGAVSDSRSSTSHDDSYLELRVKRERAALAHNHTTPHATPVKKKKKDRNIAQVEKHSEQETEYLNATNSKKIKKTKRSTDPDVIHERDSVGGNTHEFKQEIAKKIKSQKAEKKQSTQSRDSDVGDENDIKNMIIEDMFSAEETVVETRHKTPSQNQANTITSNDKESKVSKKDGNYCYTSKEFVSDDSSDDNTTTDNSNINKSSTTQPSGDVHVADESSNSENKTKKTRNRSAAKLSDRIQFEDKDDVDIESSVALDDTMSSRFRRFLKANPYLRSIVAKLDSDTLISKNDEVWILQCPHEVDIRSLKDRDLVLDSKCKVKVDGRTYDGALENEKGMVAILSVEHNTSVIKNVPLTGTINFRKRIPKAHFMEDNIIANNQTNFIPLPDTKCRHPLFGSDYKRRIKVPSSVRARLNATEPELPDRKKKKKHKRQQSVPPESETQFQTKLEPEGELRRKKRKHKHSGDEEPAPKKIKRLKHDPEGADAWESEKAIEENLFNY